MSSNIVIQTVAGKKFRKWKTKPSTSSKTRLAAFSMSLVAPRPRSQCWEVMFWNPICEFISADACDPVGAKTLSTIQHWNRGERGATSNSSNSLKYEIYLRTFFLQQYMRDVFLGAKSLLLSVGALVVCECCGFRLQRTYFWVGRSTWSVVCECCFYITARAAVQPIQKSHKTRPSEKYMFFQISFLLVQLMSGPQAD